jgi:hypothetical protein
MATKANDQPGRDKPNESEDQPDFASQEEAQHGARREGGFDDRRKDEVSSPAPDGVDPKRDRWPQDERRIAEERGEGGRLPGRQY